MLLSIILRDSDYKLSQFREEKIQELERRIVVQNNKYFINCLIRKKDIRLTPEEAIRQLYVMTLKDEFGYPASRMELEYPVSFGREKKRADINHRHRRDAQLCVSTPPIAIPPVNITPKIKTMSNG